MTNRSRKKRRKIEAWISSFAGIWSVCVGGGGRGSHWAGGQVLFHAGVGAAVAETNQGFYRLFNVRGLDGLKRKDDGGIGRCRRY